MPEPPVIPERLPRPDSQATDALVPTSSDPSVAAYDRYGQPVQYAECQLRGPDGERIPMLERVNTSTLVSTKIRSCSGANSWCSKQCPLSFEQQDSFSGKACPVELQHAWLILEGLAHDFHMELEAGEHAGEMTKEDVLDQLTRLDQIGTYIFWSMAELRAQMAMARESMVIQVAVPVRGEAVMQPIINPTFEVNERITNIRMKLWDRFMVHARARFERAVKIAENQDVVDSMFQEAAKRRLSRQGGGDGEVIDGEFADGPEE